MKKLNLGCGAYKKVGYINVDINPRIHPDVIHDLNELPYPFPDNSFNLIEADHVLEHLEDPFEVMKELHRIMKNKGRLIIKVPHFSRGFTHSGHRRGFDVSFPYYFNPSFKGGYIGKKFTLKKMRLTWFAQPYLKKSILSRPSYIMGSGMGKIFDSIANLAPFFCSRFWCFWVGGFEEIVYHFICKK